MNKAMGEPKDGDIRVARDSDDFWLAEYCLSRRWLIGNWQKVDGVFPSRGDAVLAARRKYRQVTFEPEWEVWNCDDIESLEQC